MAAAASGSWVHSGHRSGSLPTTPAGTTVGSGSARSEYTASTIASRSMARTIASRSAALARLGLLTFMPKNSSAWNGVNAPSP